MERTDKIIALSLGISRKEAAMMIKKGKIKINGKTIKNPAFKTDEIADEILCGGERVKYQKHIYIMMNKPEGVICASDGKGEKTVIDLLPNDMKRKGLFPAGRLDKDTTGFVLITDDGKFAHDILSPKKHIKKTYIALLSKGIDDDTAAKFKEGINLGGTVCTGSAFALNEDKTLVKVELTQGVYHQIKRSFASFGITVLKLKRTKMGDLSLDENLALGECRYITPNELNLIA